MYKVEQVNNVELLNKQWAISKLAGFKTGRNSGLPFSITMTELTRVILK